MSLMFVFFITLLTVRIIYSVFSLPQIKLSQEDRDYTPSPRHIASYFKEGFGFVMDRNTV